MAKGTVNKVMLIGNLGREPEVRYTPNGLAVANIAIATTESWKDKQTNETQERTEWHRVVFYGRTAEVIGEYLHKGSKIFVEGRLQTRKWQDKTTGQDKYTTEIVGDTMQMLDGKGGAAVGQSNDHASQAHPADAQQSQPALANDSFDDDDVPF